MKFVLALVAAAAAIRFDEYTADQQTKYEAFTKDAGEEREKVKKYVTAREAQAKEHAAWDVLFNNYEAGKKHYLDVTKPARDTARDELFNAEAEVTAKHDAFQTAEAKSAAHNSVGDWDMTTDSFNDDFSHLLDTIGSF